MPRFINQDDPASVVSDAPKGPLSDDQFSTLVELLRPGHELSTYMLEDYKSQHPDRFAAPADGGAPQTDGGATT
jgi:hypothetical protein